MRALVLLAVLAASLSGCLKEHRTLTIELVNDGPAARIEARLQPTSQWTGQPFGSPSLRTYDLKADETWKEDWRLPMGAHYNLTFTSGGVELHERLHVCAVHHVQVRFNGTAFEVRILAGDGFAGC